MGSAKDTLLVPREVLSRVLGVAMRTGADFAEVFVEDTLYMKPLSLDRDEIVASTRNGFLVAEVKGLTVGGFNVVSGDLSVGASGLWIKDGKVVGPVREVIIAGNLKTMLQDVDAVCNDFKWSGVGTPSFRVKRMAVSGK